MKEVKAIIDATSVFSNTFSIKWRITDACNYRCSYCIRNQGIDKRGSTPLSTNELCNIAKDIANLINQIDEFDIIKLELLGGEAAILDLHEVLSSLLDNTTKLMSIHMTTNLSRSAEYFINLFNLVNDHNCILNMTGSMHSDFVEMDDFFNKVIQIRSQIANQDHINVEMVSLTNNIDTVNAFRDKCIENNLDYKIEADVNNASSDLIAESSLTKLDKYYKYNSETGELFWSDTPKDGYSLCEGRYLMIYDNDEPEVINLRNELLHREDIDIIYKTGRFDTSMKQFYCTDSYNFVNILYDKITTCRYPDIKIDIKDFEVITLDNSICEIGTCTLCGNLSISTDKNLLRRRDE